MSKFRSTLFIASNISKINEIKPDNAADDANAIIFPAFLMRIGDLLYWPRRICIRS